MLIFNKGIKSHSMEVLPVKARYLSCFPVANTPEFLKKIVPSCYDVIFERAN